MLHSDVTCHSNILSCLRVRLRITCQSFAMANVKTEPSVFDQFHLPAEIDGEFKAQCKHCCSEISGSRKMNSNFLTHLNARHTFSLKFLVSL